MERKKFFEGVLLECNKCFATYYSEFNYVGQECQIWRFDKGECGGIIVEKYEDLNNKKIIDF